MADEKKTVKKEDTSKAEKKVNPAKKVGNFFVKIGKAIAKFFKDLKGETKKIVWPGRQMVLKSTGIVLAAILVIMPDSETFALLVALLRRLLNPL